MSRREASRPASDTLPRRVSAYLKSYAVDIEDHIDAARHRLNSRFGLDRPRYIAAYRGFGDASGVELQGRVLADRPRTGPREDDAWWDNLLDTYRRFESDEIPHEPLRLRLRGTEIQLSSDEEGYYHAIFDTAVPPSDEPWENAFVSLADGTLATPQPVLQVSPRAGVGVVSDIDDTVLHSSITDWKTAAELTFLHNARTRKPLDGVAKLYQAMQAGGGDVAQPLFYVSSSPWNLYDLLEDFMELNGIPCGPIFLRDLGLDAGKFIKSAGHGHKLERTVALIERFPHLRWVLLGDSGQADAELYAEAARSHGERIAAIYIRDVDPDDDSPLDAFVDSHIERVTGTSVPMLRARDSVAIAEHAAGLGLIDSNAVAGIVADVRRDKQRPTLAEAAIEEISESSGDPDPTSTDRHRHSAKR